MLLLTEEVAVLTVNVRLLRNRLSVSEREQCLLAEANVRRRGRSGATTATTFVGLAGRPRWRRRAFIAITSSSYPTSCEESNTLFELRNRLQQVLILPPHEVRLRSVPLDELVVVCGFRKEGLHGAFRRCVLPLEVLETEGKRLRLLLFL